MYKVMLNSNKCIETLTKCMNTELIKTDKPNTWKMSKTKLIEKKKEPNGQRLETNSVNRYRPIV